MLNFTLTLIDDKNKEIKFENREKNFPIVSFLIKFLVWINLPKKKHKRLGNSISRKKYKKEKIAEKRQYKVETDSEEEDEESDTQEEEREGTSEEKSKTIVYKKFGKDKEKEKKAKS